MVTIKASEGRRLLLSELDPLVTPQIEEALGLFKQAVEPKGFSTEYSGCYTYEDDPNGSSYIAICMKLRRPDLTKHIKTGLFLSTSEGGAASLQVSIRAAMKKLDQLLEKEGTLYATSPR